MKKSKRLAIAFGVIALTCYSWYAIFSEGMEKQQRYDNYLKEARENSELGVVSVAKTYYEQALSMHDSIELRLELAECYLNNNQASLFLDTCRAAIDLEPFDVKPYELLMDYYFTNGEYSSCYSVYKDTSDKNILSQSIENYYEQMKYKYKFADAKYNNITEYRNGYAITCYDNGYYGYVSSSASKAFNETYIKATPFSNGYAAVIDRNGQAMIINDNGVKTYVDPKKREITDVKSYASYAFAVQIDGKYTYVDLQFNDIGGSFDDAGAFLNGVSIVLDNGKWYVIDESLNKLGQEFDDIKMDFVDVAFRMQRGFGKIGDSYYLINQQGEKVTDTAYEDADVFYNGCAAVKKEGNWGFIDKEGKWIIQPTYDEAKSFANGYAAVCTDGEWFFINEQGNKVISGNFEGAYDMTDNGTAFVCVNNEWRLLQLYSYGH